MDHHELSEKIKEYFWWHTIDLGGGLLTPGRKTREILEPESAAVFSGIDLTGRSVMDIGAWNGFYTVEAFRRGACRVVAVDKDSWLHPLYRGKETFDLVMSHLDLTVETAIADVQEISPDLAGTVDVVLFLGVFYHLVDPIAAVMRLGKIATEVIVVETHLDAQTVDQPAMIFYPSGFAGDATNWWGPNPRCVNDLLVLAGFPLVTFQPNPAPGHASHRGIFHAYRSQEAYWRHTGLAAPG